MWFIISCKVKNNLLKKLLALLSFKNRHVNMRWTGLYNCVPLNLSKNTRCFWVCIARADYWFWYYQSIFYSAAWIQQLWFQLYCKTEINTREGLNFDFLNLLSGFLVLKRRLRARMKKKNNNNNVFVWTLWQVTHGTIIILLIWTLLEHLHEHQ